MAQGPATTAFVPWLRRGIGIEIPEVDTLGATDGTAIEHVEMSASLTLKTASLDGIDQPNAAVVAKTLRLVGPGAILSLKKDAFLRTEPHPDARRMPSNTLAYIEFYDADLPWRYTPARPAEPSAPEAQRHKLRPWLALFVLAEGEFEEPAQPPVDGLPTFTVLGGAAADQVLPRHDEHWAWAHVHVHADAGDVDATLQAIRDQPDGSVSRLISPRRLAANTRYIAFLVPAFETGRLAGLGEDPSAVPAQMSSWKSGAMPHSVTRPNTYPHYHRWQFETGAYGDFESLVKRLSPCPAGPTLGRRDLDVTAPGYGLDGIASVQVVQLEGALVPTEFVPVSFPASPGPELVAGLEALVDLSENLQSDTVGPLPNPFYEADGLVPEVTDDPILSPPLVGGWHAGVSRAADAQDPENAWVRELNLDPRARVAAGLGAEVVRSHQEPLMARAWQQVRQLRDANQRLREAELVAAANDGTFRKHFAGRGIDRTLTLTSAAQGGLAAVGGTVHGRFQESRVPNAMKSAAFKRVTRPQRKLLRRLTGSTTTAGLHTAIVDRFNADVASRLSAAAKLAEPDISLPMARVTTAVGAAVGAFTVQPRDVLAELLYRELSSRLQQGEDLSALPIGVLRTYLSVRLNYFTPVPTEAVELAVRDAIAALVSVDHDGPEGARVELSSVIFTQLFGAAVSARRYRGVLMARPGASGVGASSMTSMSQLQGYSADLAVLDADLQQVPGAADPPELAHADQLAFDVLGALRPTVSMHRRVAHVVQAGISTRPQDEPRRLRPVTAHPLFPEPQFASLKRLSAEHILPNHQDLPQNAITLLQSNQRFIESFLAGQNHEMCRELLWREFPTDLRGTSFQTFWDTRDASAGATERDIEPMNSWSHPLGGNSERSGSFLVLVIRGELFERYPRTVVTAQRAVWSGGDLQAPRELAAPTPATVLFPAFQAELEPDIALFGFALDPDEARGQRPVDPADPSDPGWFFVLQERPGQPTFGLDDQDTGGTTPPLSSWDDLHQEHLGPANCIELAANPLVLDGTGGPDAPTQASWAKSSADMAYILLQSPVIFARHAEEMLP